MSGHPELDAMARRVIDVNHYMTLATRDRVCRPRMSPVYHTAARYTDFYRLSSAAAHHSRNVAEHPEIEIVVFDSTARVDEGEAVYLAAIARAIRDEELEAICPQAFRTTAGARGFARTSCAAIRTCASTSRTRRPARSMCPDAIPSTAAASTRASPPTRRGSDRSRR